MSYTLDKAVKVSLNEKVEFRCRKCADCCRHIFRSVPLESLDVFRMSKYLRDNGGSIKCIDDFLDNMLNRFYWMSADILFMCSKPKELLTNAYF